jgi:hypothetical protein
MPPQQPMHEQEIPPGEAPLYVAEVTVIVPPNVKVNILQTGVQNATSE